MKIRGEGELLDFLADRKQHRKRELISLKHDLTPRTETVPARTLRTSVVLSYAHWEGFVKDAARAYVRLVSQKTRSFESLSSNFQALVCRQEFSVASTATRRIGPHIALVELFTTSKGRSAAIDAEAAIDTESNLTSEVFKNICDCVGIDYISKWSVEGPFMDDLFEARCAIAHGELLTPEISYSNEVVDLVIRWIESFANDVENAALLKSYLRAS